MKKIDNLINNNNNLENKLISSFLESSKNQKFKQLVEKINLPIETLAKYTSILEDCAEEYDRCKNCKGLTSCKNKIEGYAYMPKVNDCKLEFGYMACKYKNKQIDETKYLKNVFCVDISKEIREAKMKDIKTEDKNRYETIKWLKDFIKSYEKNPKQKGLYLSGSFGGGKTYLVAATLNELAKNGVKSGIVFWPDFLRNLKSKFNNNYEQEINHLKKLPILCIDDIGAETTTSWSRDEVLCPIVQYRMQEHLPTFFTSNLNYKTLEQHFSTTKDGVEEVKAKRIIERIIQLTDFIEMNSENLRK